MRLQRQRPVAGAAAAARQTHWIQLRQQPRKKKQKRAMTNPNRSRESDSRNRQQISNQNDRKCRVQRSHRVVAAAAAANRRQHLQQLVAADFLLASDDYYDWARPRILADLHVHTTVFTAAAPLRSVPDEKGFADHACVTALQLAICSQIQLRRSTFLRNTVCHLAATLHCQVWQSHVSLLSGSGSVLPECQAHQKGY